MLDSFPSSSYTIFSTTTKKVLLLISLSIFFYAVYLKNFSIRFRVVSLKRDKKKEKNGERFWERDLFPYITCVNFLNFLSKGAFFFLFVLLIFSPFLTRQTLGVVHMYDNISVTENFGHHYHGGGRKEGKKKKVSTIAILNDDFSSVLRKQKVCKKIERMGTDVLIFPSLFCTNYLFVTINLTMVQLRP